MASISGRWRLNDELSYALGARVPVNFVSNGFRYYYINIGYNANAIILVPTVYSEDNNIMTDMAGHILYTNTYVRDASFFRELDFGSVGQSVSDDFYQWASSYMTYIGESLWEPVYQVSASAGDWQLREAYKYHESEWVKISSLHRVYAVTMSLSGITGDTNNLTASIAEDGMNQYYLEASDGGTLPEAVNVTNASVVEWDKSTGRLVIDKPTGEVIIQTAV